MFKEVETQSNTTVDINISQIALMLKDGQIKVSSGDVLRLTPESYEKLRAIIYPVKKTTKNPEPKDELATLFAKLHKLTGGKGVAVFSLQREKKLSDLLGKHRLTEELLIKAATNIGKNAFLQGDNDQKVRYGNVDYLLRPDKAAKWSEDQTQKKKTGMF